MEEVTKDYAILDATHADEKEQTQIKVLNKEAFG